MFDPAKVVAILKDEYGIESQAELRTALANLGKINIAPFCGKRPNEKESAS